jgi:hypothetical protein
VRRRQFGQQVPHIQKRVHGTAACKRAVHAGKRLGR